MIDSWQFQGSFWFILKSHPTLPHVTGIKLLSSQWEGFQFCFVINGQGRPNLVKSWSLSSTPWSSPCRPRWPVVLFNEIISKVQSWTEWKFCGTEPTSKPTSLPKWNLFMFFKILEVLEAEGTFLYWKTISGQKVKVWRLIVVAYFGSGHCKILYKMKMLSTWFLPDYTYLVQCQFGRSPTSPSSYKNILGMLVLVFSSCSLPWSSTRVSWRLGPMELTKIEVCLQHF